MAVSEDGFLEAVGLPGTSKPAAWVGTSATDWALPRIRLADGG